MIPFRDPDNPFQASCLDAWEQNHLLTIECEGGRVYKNVSVAAVTTNEVTVCRQGVGTPVARKKTIPFYNVRSISIVVSELTAYSDEQLNDELKKRERKKNPTYNALMDSMRDRESPFVNVHMKNGVSYYQVYVVKIDYDTSNGRGSALLRPETSDREIEVDINEISQICKDNLLPLMTEYVMHRDTRARQAVIRMIAEGKTEKSYYDE